jgi:hypothetical protein
MSSNYPPNQPPPGGYPPPGYQQGPPPGYGQPRPKGSNKWIFWLLGGCLGLILIVAIVIFAGGYFVYNKAKQAGLDPELMQKKPALAAAKLMAAMNPDVEVVNADDDKGLITIRDKKTGETITMTVDEAKKGKVSFKKNGKDLGSVEMRADKDQGSLEVKTDEGTAKFGSGIADKLPGWIPSYPGAAVQWDAAVHSKDGQTGSFHFTTTDSADRVVSFYEEELKNAGFKVTSSTVQSGDQGKTKFLVVQDSSNKRSGTIMALSDTGGRIRISVTFQSKE